MLAQRVFVPSMKRRDGEGRLGVEIKFGGWQVVWRGVRMTVYVASVSFEKNHRWSTTVYQKANPGEGERHSGWRMVGIKDPKRISVSPTYLVPSNLVFHHPSSLQF
jgi:hypothetical protein